MGKKLGFLRTTAIGGLLFLFPLIVVGALLGQAVPIVIKVAEALGKWIPVKTASGVSLLIGLAVVIVLLICFAAGLLARRSIGRRLSQSFEKNLMLLFPRYAIFKDQMAGTIGGGADATDLQPVLARFDDCTRLGFEVERRGDELVTVYLPGAPDPWSGTVFLLAPDRVQPIDVDFGKMVASFEKLGRDSAELLTGQAK